MKNTSEHAGIQREIDRLHLLKHPFYQAWMQGELSVGTLQDYAAQYAHHVDRFPRYLSAIHSLCESPLERKMLLENLNDEEGTAHGVSHPELWMQFAKGLGATPAAPRAAIQKVSQTFFRLARKSYHEGLGALFAYEAQVPEVAASKIQGLVERYGIQDAATLEFFQVHRQADVAHRESIAQVLETLPAPQYEEAKTAAREAAQALWDFLSEVHDQAAHAC